MKANNRCVLLAALTLASGAAFSKDKAAAAPVCVEGAALMQPQPLRDYVKTKKGKLKFHNKSECLRTADGAMVRAAMFELPASTEAYSVNISSLIQKGVVVPRVEMLDAQRQVTRTFGIDGIKRRGDSLALSIFLNDENRNERFMLIYPDPSLLGAGESRSSMGVQTAFIGTGIWFSGSETQQQLTYTDSGTVVLALQGAQWNDK